MLYLIFSNLFVIDFFLNENLSNSTNTGSNFLTHMCIVFSIYIKYINYTRLLLRFCFREFPASLQENDASLPFPRRARKLCAPSISGRGSKVQTFFLARTTFHLRRPATVSRDLSTAKRRCANRRATRAETTWGLRATPYDGLTPSSLIAALTQSPCAIEASGKVAARRRGHRIPFRGTRNTEYPF